MAQVNRVGTETLVEECRSAGVGHFVLGSSIWAMASTKWPSVMNPESAAVPPAAELPFPAYAQSKLAAEALLFAQNELR